MRLKDLPVGSKFIIVREHEPNNVYEKISGHGRYNAIMVNRKYILPRMNSYLLIIHELTEVEEIK